MNIEIHNPSSPGTSFSDWTNSVILETYKWICEHKGSEYLYKELRENIQQDKKIGETKINDNNSRNIYPLLKNCKLVQYETGKKKILTDKFFTAEGLAYVKLIETDRILKNSTEYTQEQITNAASKLLEIQQNIIYWSLQNIISNPDASYSKSLSDMIEFLLKYQKINIKLYAYFLYEIEHQETKNVGEILNKIQHNVDLYLKGDIDYDVIVMVWGKETKTWERRSIDRLTAYTYLTRLLNEADLIIEDSDFYTINQQKKKLLEQLIGVTNG